MDHAEGIPGQRIDPAARLGASTGSTLPSRFRVAAVGSAVVVLLAVVIIVLAPPGSPDDLIPALIATGGLCAGLLFRHRVPGLAWASLVVASLVAASVPIAISREADPQTLGLEAWLVVAVRSVVAAIISVGVAALYATRPERQATRRVTTIATLLVAWVSAACLFVIYLVVAGTKYDPAITLVDLAIAPTALYVHIVLLLGAFGVAGDIRLALERADAHLALARPVGGPARAPIRDRMGAMVRELIPGQADADAAAIDAERTRLAGDLHAVVLPALRRAIADAETGGAVETLADRLRAVDLELERLMADRWPVVLEAFGLVEALEDLAERTEADSRVEIGLEVESASGRPPSDVERTGWRIVQLALDNAVRHASATTITLSITVAPDRLQLAVSDDGRGIDAAAAKDARRAGSRGLADLELRAARVDGRISVEPRPGGGTVVRFDWTARG